MFAYVSLVVYRYVQGKTSLYLAICCTALHRLSFRSCFRLAQYFSFLGFDMTTIVYKEEMITSTASSGAPRNVQSKMVTVQILSDGTSGSRTSGPSNTPRHQSRRGSPKPNKKIHNVREGSKLGKGSFTAGGYNSHPFTITAYLPHDEGKRLKVGSGKDGIFMVQGGEVGLVCTCCLFGLVKFGFQLVYFFHVFGFQFVAVLNNLSLCQPRH